ncbi:MAG TPA: SGNH/GDSL hydrolase family protein, partial [Rariglobus sp.]
MKLINLVRLSLITGLLYSAAAARADTDARGRVTIAPLGDSRTAIISFDAAGLNQSTQSHLTWANALSNQRFYYTGTFGVSGATSDGIIATKLAPALATKPRFMTIFMGVNDVRTPGFSAEHTLANIAEAAGQALAQGTTPIVFTDPGNEHYQPSQVAFINDLNERIKTYCATTKGAVLFDMAALVSTQRNPAIVFQPGWSPDGVHFQTLGAYKAGAAFAAFMDTLVKSPSTLSNPAVNLLVNPAFTGAGGAIGNGNTGSLPDGFSGTRDNANCTAAYSLNSRKDGAQELVMSLTSTDANKLGGGRITQTIPVSNLSPGEALQAGVEVDIEPGSVNLLDVRVEITYVFGDGTFAIAYDFNGTTKRDTISSIPLSRPLSLTLQSPVNAY